MDTLPGPHLVTAEQISALSVGSIIETNGGESYSVVYHRKPGYWSGSDGGHIYSANGFVIGKTYLVRSGPLK